MKKHIVLLTAAVFFLAACDLDKKPLSSLSPDSFFGSATELDAFANNFYLDFPGTSVYEEESDMIIKNGLTNEMRSARQIPASGGGWTWTSLRDYNTLIEYAEKQCNDKAVREQYIAIARFFRANFYFEKVRRFGDVPWYDHQLGSADPELYKARDSRELVMTNVIADLDYATEHLPSAKSVYKVTRWTALALKSRACLFEGTFRKYHNVNLPEHGWEYYLEQAAAAADAFISTSGYRIATGDPKTCYRDLFASADAVADEVILARNYDLGLNILHNATYFTIGNYGQQSMTRKMACTYLMADGSRFTDKEGWETMLFKDETKDRDPRMSQSIRTPGYKRIGGSNVLAPSFSNCITGYQICKYMLGEDAGADMYNKSYNDLPLFRTAEVLLNYAEAKAELGTLTQADIDRSIKPIRDRVGMPNMNLSDVNANPDSYLTDEYSGYPNVSGSMMGAILEIRRERSVELFDENFRYYDLIRWKNGQAFKHQYLGIYIPAPGVYDLDGNGTDDICFFTGSAPSGLPASVLQMKIGEKIYFTEGDHGYVLTNKNTPGAWNEERDYFYPIPINDRSLTKGALVQNPGWDDGLSF